MTDSREFQPPRGSRHEPQYSRAYDEAEREYNSEKFAEAISAIDWILDRDPFAGRQIVSDCYLYEQDGNVHLNVPRVLLLYRIDADRFTFIDAKFEPPVERNDMDIFT